LHLGESVELLYPTLQLLQALWYHLINESMQLILAM
jgi:hypothetical protein